MPRSGRLQAVAATLAGLFVLVGLPGLLVAGRVHTQAHLLHVEDQRPVALTAGEGDEVSIDVVLHQHLSDSWASDGLVLSGDGLTPVTVLGGRAKDWGDSLLLPVNASGASDTTLGGPMTIPVTGLSRPRIVEATLAGSIVYPAPSGDGAFDDRTLEVAVPIRLTLLPRGAAAWSSGANALALFLGLDITIGLFFLAFAAADAVRVVRYGVHAYGFVWLLKLVVARGAVMALVTFAGSALIDIVTGARYGSGLSATNQLLFVVPGLAGAVVSLRLVSRELRGFFAVEVPR